jgi:pilus assembly protein CpaC
MGARAIKRAALAAAAFAVFGMAAPAVAQVSVASGIGAGELEVPVNKSQVLHSDRPYAKALIGNPEIADIVPISDTSVYVLGKKTGTTSLTLYDRANRLIAVVDIAVGPDVMTLKHQLADLVPGGEVSARMSNESVVLEGIVRNAVDADRAVQIAETYAPGHVVNLLSLASSQQVMLEVRFAEIKRSALMQLGLNWDVLGDHGKLNGVIGGGAPPPPRIDRGTGAAISPTVSRSSRGPSVRSVRTSTSRSTRSKRRVRSRLLRNRPWLRCRAKPQASLPAANFPYRSSRMSAAAEATAVQALPTPLNGSRSGSAWLLLRRSLLTASST